MKLRKWATAMTVGCVAYAALTGCASGERLSGDLATSDEILDRGFLIYSAAQQVLGTDGWSQREQWFSCGLNDETAEVQLRIDSQLDRAFEDTPEHLAAGVQRAWSRLGVDATLTVNSDLEPTRYIVSDPPFLAGTNEDGAITNIWVSEGFADFGYVSPCIPGNIFDLQRQVTDSPGMPVTPPSSP